MVSTNLPCFIDLSGKHLYTASTTYPGKQTIYTWLLLLKIEPLLEDFCHLRKQSELIDFYFQITTPAKPSGISSPKPWVLGLQRGTTIRWNTERWKWIIQHSKKTFYKHWIHWACSKHHLSTQKVWKLIFLFPTAGIWRPFFWVCIST